MFRKVVIMVLGLCLAGCAGLPPPYVAADAPRYTAYTTAPRVALVLGGGGPRGFAHVGALRALEAAGIRPDLIVGSSVGAVVGAVWASGVPAAQIEAIALDLGVRDMFDASDLTLSRWGWVRGESLQRYVNQWVKDRPIESFPIRFAAATTEIPIGKLALFNTGNAGLAVRASSAIPGQISPVRIGKGTYVDGDLVSPVPVMAARKLGASVVIALDVSADLSKAPDLKRMSIDWITTGAIRRTLVEHERSQATVFVPIDLPYYAGGSREYREMAIRRGEAAINAVLPAILAAVK